MDELEAHGDGYIRNMKTASSPNVRIEITQTEIAGYSDATTKQFYIQASDGKGYFAAGSAVIASDGLTITGSDYSVKYIIFKENANMVGAWLFTYDAENMFCIENNTDGVTIFKGISIGRGLYGIDEYSIELLADSANPANQVTNIYMQAGLVSMSACNFMTLPQKATAPTSPAEGWLYYDTATHTIVYHNGTVWKTVATV